MRKIFSIITTDIRYGNALAKYINDSKRIPMKTFLYSSFKEYIDNDMGYKSEIMLLDSKLYHEDSVQDNNGFLILLSEDRLTDIVNEKRFVMKYRSAEEILSKIMDIYDESCGDKLINIASINHKIIGVFSPINRCGKSVFSMLLAVLKSNVDKTLLMSFEEYLGNLYGSITEKGPDLSDILYHYKQGNYSWGKLCTCVRSIEGLDYISPARYSEDLYCLDMDEMKDLILRIAHDGEYKNIIIDFGSLGKRGIDLFDICNKIYMPTLDDKTSAKKIEEFESLLALYNKAEFKDKIEKVSLPGCKNQNINIISMNALIHSPLGEYTYKVLEEAI